MALKDALLPEFDQEMATTRALLAAVPADRADWKPHAKSMSLGQLAEHLANMPQWMLITLDQDSFDLNPPGGSGFQQRGFEGTAKLLTEFDAGLGQARAALERVTDEQFMRPWSLKNGGVVQMTFPRAVVVRTFVLSHMIHHRGQLSVYLRLLDVPVPGVYGPTADTK
jgi:uncharacterized damage-inducible protein DinB